MNSELVKFLNLYIINIKKQNKNIKLLMLKII